MSRLTVMLVPVCSIESSTQADALNHRTKNTLIAGSAGRICAAADSGGFRSAINGDTWTQVNTGLTTLSANAFVIDPARYVNVGTIKRDYMSLKVNSYNN